MLQMTQKLVGTGQIVKFLAADVPFVVQFLQRKESSSRSQPRLCASVYALQALHQKFNVADSSAINFHVDDWFGLSPHLAVVTPALHFLARHQRRLDRRKIDLIG